MTAADEVTRARSGPRVRTVKPRESLHGDAVGRGCPGPGGPGPGPP